MVHIRPKTVVDSEYSSNVAYTIDLDLPSKGLVSTLYLMAKYRQLVNGQGPNAWARNLISSVSVNQAGQEQLNAAPPDMFIADAYYKTGKFPRCNIKRWGTAGDRHELIPIMFGDKVDDPEHYIDLGKLNDPQISVTYDLAGTDNEAAAPFNQSYYPRFDVIANFLEGPGIPPSKGYQSLRQIAKYETADDLVKKIELKGARPIKRILFQNDLGNIAYEMRQCISRIKLWGSNEAWVPLNMTSERFVDMVRRIFGLGVAEMNFETCAQGKTVNTIFEGRQYIGIMLHNSKTVQAYAYGGSGHGFVMEYVTMSSGATSSATQNGFFRFSGIAPYAIYPIDMPKMLGREYMDPVEHAPVFLELTHDPSAATTGDDIRVCVEDLAKQL